MNNVCDRKRPHKVKTTKARILANKYLKSCHVVSNYVVYMGITHAAIKSDFLLIIKIQISLFDGVLFFKFPWR